MVFNQCTQVLRKGNEQRDLKKLLYHCKYPEKSRVLSLKPTGISKINIGGTTIHSGLAIKPVTKLFDLNEKSNTALASKLSE